MAARPFSLVLAAIRYGGLHDELTDQLAALVKACNDTGRKGSLTLTLSLKPGKAGQIELADDIKVKIPAHEKGQTLLFATPEGNLQREDPRQMSLEGLREVPAPAPAKELQA